MIVYIKLLPIDRSYRAAQFRSCVSKLYFNRSAFPLRRGFRGTYSIFGVVSGSAQTHFLASLGHESFVNGKFYSVKTETLPKISSNSIV